MFADSHPGASRGERASTRAQNGKQPSRAYLNRYEEAGLQGLMDKRMNQVSQRRAPVDEVMALTALYRSRYSDWNVRHFHSWYRREHAGARSSNS